MNKYWSKQCTNKYCIWQFSYRSIT